MAATCAGLGDSQGSQVVNLGWLLLALGLGLTEASYYLFDRICEVVKHEPTPAIHMGKQFGWTCKLGGCESQGMSRVRRAVLARLMESQIWHQLAGSMRQRFRKATMASAHLDARHFSSSLYATVAFQAAAPLLELRGSESVSR